MILSSRLFPLKFRSKYPEILLHSCSATFGDVFSSKNNYAVSVEVKDNNIEAALAQLKRRCIEADLPQEIRKRSHHLNPSERRYLNQTKSYNRAMGRVISERIQWLTKRRLIK
jgi:ribosomal protein S21